MRGPLSIIYGDVGREAEGGEDGGRCRIGFLNVQGLTVAKSVEIKNLMVSGGDGSEREVILGLVET